MEHRVEYDGSVGKVYKGLTHEKIDAMSPDDFRKFIFDELETFDVACMLIEVMPEQYTMENVASGFMIHGRLGAYSLRYHAIQFVSSPEEINKIKTFFHTLVREQTEIIRDEDTTNLT